MLAIEVFGTFLAIVGFAIVLDTPKRYIIRAGLVGAAAGFVYLVAMHYKVGVVVSSFLSAFAAAVISHTLARTYKAPVTVFLIAGILPTVPGAGMYRTVYYLIKDHTALAENYLWETLKTAGMIALAVFLADSIFKLFKNDGWKQDSLRYVRKEKNERTDV